MLDFIVAELAGFWRHSTCQTLLSISTHNQHSICLAVAKPVNELAAQGATVLRFLSVCKADMEQQIDDSNTYCTETRYKIALYVRISTDNMHVSLHMEIRASSQGCCTAGQDRRENRA